MRTATFSLRLSKAERRALSERARRDGITQGSLVRRALRAYGVAPDTGRTGHDVIRHLLGMNGGGSTDLSTNPEYLKDYGR
jgi:hypothetical protein